MQIMIKIDTCIFYSYCCLYIFISKLEFCVCVCVCVCVCEIWQKKRIKNVCIFSEPTNTRKCMIQAQFQQGLS